MVETINAAAVTALAGEPLDWRFKGLPASWWGRTAGQICSRGAEPGRARRRWVRCACCVPRRCHTTSRRWPAGVVTGASSSRRTARPTWPRSCWPASSRRAPAAVTVATISQARIYRAFGVRDFILANELVDAAALRWLAAELDGDADFTLTCWVDSVAGVEQMTSWLAAGAADPSMSVWRSALAGGRTGCPRRVRRRRGRACRSGLSRPASRRRCGLRGRARSRHLAGRGSHA